MRTIVDVYEEYRIMPQLQLHQLRVAAVAKFVCDHFKAPLDARSIITAALFHDMGNIVKFDFSYFPQFLEPKGLAYWQSVKDEFISTYGSDSHSANIEIAKEIGLSKIVINLVDTVSFSKMRRTLERGTHEQRIVEYADTRVGPFGILSIEERFIDGAKRYANRYKSSEDARSRYSEQTEIGLAIERSIFEHAGIHPIDITDAEIAPLADDLKHFQVK